MQSRIAMPNPPPIGDTCGGCKFAKNPPVHVNLGVQADKLCFRFPPQVTSFLMGRDPSGQPVTGSFSSRPGVKNNDEACGEWKPRIQLQ